MLNANNLLVRSFKGGKWPTTFPEAELTSQEPVAATLTLTLTFTFTCTFTLTLTVTLTLTRALTLTRTQALNLTLTRSPWQTGSGPSARAASRSQP